MAWYKTGTVSVTNNSATVTGSGTNFVSGAQVGFGFQGPNGLVYEITAINSSTSLTITPVYGGSTASGQSYAIVPTQGLTAALASDVTDLITDYQTVADNAGAGKFGDGSAASPGIRFVNDQDTGFFKDTANEIAVSVGGTKVGEFTSTGIDGTVIGGTTPAAITATTFTSTGIDDNASSTAMTLDSSGNVGIGTSSPSSSSKLHVEGGASEQVQIRVSQSDNTGVYLFSQSGSSGVWNQDNTPMLFATNNTEAMRIDSSGNLLVGKTSVDSSVAGGEIRSHGGIVGARSGNWAGIFNRLTNDGDIVQFRKDGSTVGSIFSNSGTYLGMGNDDVGLLFLGAANDIRPWNPSTNTARDAGIDLGDSSTRFKDLYLSGGVYLGGTGSANKLDDYEEGTWTPVVAETGSGGTTATGTFTGTYTKVGRMVTVNAVLVDITTSGMTAGNILYLRGLPFAAGTGHIGSNLMRSVTYSGQIAPRTLDGQSYLYFYQYSTGGAVTPLTIGGISSGVADIWFTVTYEV